MSLRRFVRRWASRRLDPDLDPRIRDYLALRFRPDRALPLAQASFVVLDTETSGLDVRRDRLLSLSAVSVRAGRIVLSDRVELTFAAASVGASEAAVVHQLVTADLHGGVDEREGVAAFLAFVRDRVLVGHHVGFDVAMIDRALARVGPVRLRNATLDTARLHRRLTTGGIASLTPDGPRPLGLDALAEAYGLDLPLRHSSAGDALATAQVFLALLARAARRGITTLGALLET